MSLCAEHRGDLALRALGYVAVDTDVGLDVHLAGCPACRADLDELRATVAALALASPEHLDARTLGPFLADVIVERAEREATETRRRRFRRAALTAAAAVIALVVAVGALAIGTNGDDPSDVVELAGDTGLQGSAVLVERAWGTEVTLDVSGLVEGETYWLWLTDAGGDRVAAGTLTGTGDDAHAVLAAALPAEETRRIWMTDEADRVVLDATVAAAPFTLQVVVPARATRHHAGMSDLAALADAMPFTKLVGIELLAADSEEVRARLAWTPDRCTAGGVMHGAALFALADTAGALLAFLNLPEGAVGTTTISSSVNFLRALTEGSATAVTTPLHRGRTTIVAVTDLVDDKGKLLGRVTQTQAVLAG